MRKLWFAISSFVLAASWASAQDADLNLPAADWKRISGDQKVVVGDRIELELEGVQSVHVLVYDEQIQKDVFAAGFAISIPAEEQQPFRLKVIPVKAGEIALPPLFFKNADGKIFLKSNAWSVTVASAKGEEGEKDPPPDFIAPMKLSFPMSFFVWCVALVGLLLFTVIYEFFLWKKRKSLIFFEKKSSVPRLEEEVALEGIVQIEKSNWIQKKEYKKIYFSLSDIFKTYFGARYSFDAKESTSREVMDQLGRRGVDPKTMEMISRFFQDLDWVKFTDHVPSDDTVAELLKVARTLIQTTQKKRVTNSQEVSHAIRQP